MTALAGDWADDDGLVLDSQLEPHPELPQREQLPTTALYQVAAPKPVTRLITGTLVLTPAWGPVQILPEDPNRIHLELYAVSSGGLGNLLVADSPTKLLATATGVQQAPFAARLGNASLHTLFRRHTGPVWVSASRCTSGTIGWTATTLTPQESA